MIPTITACVQPKHCDCTYRLYQFAVLCQRLLVLDIVARQPCLDLVTQPLQLLDLCLELGFDYLE